MVEPSWSSFSLEVEAIASYTSSIDSKFQSLFPTVITTKDPNFTRFAQNEENELPFCSFKLGSESESVVLKIGLEKAVNISDTVTFSSHGSEHCVFPEAVETLIDSLKKGTVVRRIQEKIVKVKSQDKEERVNVNRLVLETPRFSRKSYEPLPFVEAKAITQNESNRLRSILKEHGMPYAVMVALFRKLDVKTIFNLFGNKQFNQNNNIKGIHGLVLSGNHPDDERHIKVLYNQIVLPVIHGETVLPYSNDDYLVALDYMQQIRWINEDQRNRLFGNIGVDKTPFARAVFKGGMEIAYTHADRRFIDPARGDYIGRKYGDVFSTKLITAFLVFD